MGLEIGTQISISGGVYLHDIINSLKTNHGITEFYMLDVTCNALMHEMAASRLGEKLGRELKPVRLGGKQKKKRGTKKRSRKKRSKTLHKKRFRNFRHV